MSGHPPRPNLTKKFSRNSLQRATLARTTSDGISPVIKQGAVPRKMWQKQSSFQEPLALKRSASMFSISNAQILHTMSSLTEDQFFVGNQVAAPPRSNPRSVIATSKAPSTSTKSFADGPLSRRISRSASFSAEGTQPTMISQSTSISSSSSRSRSLGARRRMASQRPPLARKLGNLTLTRPKGLTSYPLPSRVNKQELKPNVTRKIRPSDDNLWFSLLQDILEILWHILFWPERFLQAVWIRHRWTADGRNVLITGASAGIGAEIARQFSADGAKIAMVAGTSDELERVADECLELGARKALHYTADLSSTTGTELAMKQAIEDFGKFDVVILNAGRTQGCYFEEIKDPHQIDQMITLNFNFAVTCLHYLLPCVPKSKDSRIVVISDTAGVVAAPYQSIYSGTKHALTGFSNSLRMELNSTYGSNAPKLSLVSFPEILEAENNIARMDMGARLPPVQCHKWAGQPLSLAIQDLMPVIAEGRRDFGQPSNFGVWRALYAMCPNLVDCWVMKKTRETHYRPFNESSTKRAQRQIPKQKTMTPNKILNNSE